MSFNSVENAFYSPGPDNALAISNLLTKNQWRFLTYGPGQAFLLESWFGKDVLAQLPLPTVKQVAPALAETNQAEWKPERLADLKLASNALTRGLNPVLSRQRLNAADCFI